MKTNAFRTGTWVWYFCNRRRVGLSPKWQKHYTGPYLIVRVISEHNLVLQKTNRSKPFVVHKDNVKMFYGEAPTSWVLRDDQENEPQETLSSHLSRVHQMSNEPGVDPNKTSLRKLHSFYRRYALLRILRTWTHL